jgi:hypothetical protein
VVRKEMRSHPAVPEFCYNSAECRQFIETIGTVNKRADFPVFSANVLSNAADGMQEETHYDPIDSTKESLRVIREFKNAAEISGEAL